MPTDADVTRIPDHAEDSQIPVHGQRQSHCEKFTGLLRKVCSAPNWWWGRDRLLVWTVGVDVEAGRHRLGEERRPGSRTASNDVNVLE